MRGADRRCQGWGLTSGSRGIRPLQLPSRLQEVLPARDVALRTVRGSSQSLPNLQIRQVCHAIFLQTAYLPIREPNPRTGF